MHGSDISMCACRKRSVASHGKTNAQGLFIQGRHKHENPRQERGATDDEVTRGNEHDELLCTPLPLNRTAEEGNTEQHNSCLRWGDARVNFGSGRTLVSCATNLEYVGLEIRARDQDPWSSHDKPGGQCKIRV